MSKLMIMLAGVLMVSGCATTQSVEELASITIGDEVSVPIRLLVNASAFEDTVLIDIKGEEKFRFVFSISTAAKTLEEEVGYNGNIVKASCKLDTSSKKNTMSYTAHNCSIFVNGKLELQAEF